MEGRGVIRGRMQRWEGPVIIVLLILIFSILQREPTYVTELKKLVAASTAELKDELRGSKQALSIIQGSSLRPSGSMNLSPPAPIITQPEVPEVPETAPIKPSTFIGSFGPGDAKALVAYWEWKRFTELWKVQGLGPDNWGGTRAPQALSILERLDHEMKENGRKFNQICEVGFWRGGSSLLWLLGFPSNVKIQSFDVKARSAAQKYLKDNFPNRWEIILGSSRLTIPTWAAENPGKCDLVFVDGDHDRDGPYQDIVSFRKASHSGTLLLADDTFDLITIDETSPPVKDRENDCSKSWKRAIEESIIARLPDKSRPMCDVMGKAGPYYVGQCWSDFALK